MFTDDIVSTQAAMAFLGMKDVKITTDGSGYTITYKDGTGVAAKQTCQYDAGKDQLTTTMYDADSNITMFFEYVNLGDHTYAAQYYYPTDGKFQVIRAYFDTSDVAAFGSLNAAEKPASILGKSGLGEDFVKNEASYFILKGGKLTTFDQGETSSKLNGARQNPAQPCGILLLTLPALYDTGSAGDIRPPPGDLSVSSASR